MSHINYAFNPEDDALPRDKMKLRNIASTKYSGDWPSIPHSHSYAELFYIVDGEGQFQINDKLFPVQAHQLVVVNPNVIHTEVSFESHPLEYIVLGIFPACCCVPRCSDGPAQSGSWCWHSWEHCPQAISSPWCPLSGNSRSRRFC